MTFFAPSLRSILLVGSRKRVQPEGMSARRRLTAFNVCRLSERYSECASVMPEAITCVWTSAKFGTRPKLLCIQTYLRNNDLCQTASANSIV